MKDYLKECQCLLIKENEINEEVSNSYDPEQLKMGIEIEKEHEDLYNVLKDYIESIGGTFPMSEEEFYSFIAKAHLNEIDQYYTLLKQMEKQAKGQK